MERYSAFLLEDDELLRGLLCRALEQFGFDATGFDEAERMMERVTRAPLAELPDVIYVDLQLKAGRMQGLDAVTALVGRNIPSEILVVSGNHPSADLVSAIMLGATLGEPKPFGIFTLAERMAQLGAIGRKRKAYWMREGASPAALDEARGARPAFLSHAPGDRNLGNGLRRNIESRGVGVWYPPMAPSADEPWLSRIEQGIDEARVFIALLSDEYVATPSCMAELTQFHHRLRTGADPGLLLLPLLAGLSEQSLAHPALREIFLDCPPVNLAAGFLDAVTATLVRIQLSLGAAPPAAPAATETPAPR